MPPAAQGTLGGLPAISLRAPKRRKANDINAAKIRVDRYFARNPHLRMIKWRLEWEATSPAMADKAVEAMRLLAFQDTDKYYIARQGKLVWITVRAPSGEETEEQKAAFEAWRSLRGRRADQFRRMHLERERDADEAVDS